MINLNLIIFKKFTKNIIEKNTINYINTLMRIILIKITQS
jgi:hypothetical protein